MSKLDRLIAELCPEGVEYKTLGEVGEFYGGLTGKSKDDFIDGNAKFITYMNVFSHLAVDTNIIDCVKIASNERQRKVVAGDVLFTGSSETREECGMSSVLVEDIGESLYLNSFCFGFRQYEPVLLPEFSKYLFRSEELRKQIVMTASGVTRFNVSKEKMKKVKISLPPIPIQHEIVRILDNFTELTAELEMNLKSEFEARKKQYEYYRNFLLAFSKNDDIILLGSRLRLTLGEIGKICMCKRIFKEQTQSTGDIPFYKIGTFGKKPDAYISRSVFDEYREKYSFPKKGDVLISPAGTIGRAVIYDGSPAYFQDSNIVWIDNDESKVLNKYLFYYYSLQPWQASGGGTITRLYNDDIRKTTISVPALNEQERIISILDRFETLTTDIANGLPAEIEARRRQYEYYRDKLLNFNKEIH